MLLQSSSNKHLSKLIVLVFCARFLRIKAPSFDSSSGPVDCVTPCPQAGYILAARLGKSIGERMHVSGLNRRYRLIDKQKNEVTIKRTVKSITINEMGNRKNKAAKKRTAQSITISEVDNRVPFSDGNHLIRRDTPGQDTQLRGRHAFTFYVHYFLLGKLKFDNNIPVQICTTVVQNTVYLLRFH
jgi:hypothetical protein